MVIITIIFNLKMKERKEYKQFKDANFKNKTLEVGGHDIRRQRIAERKSIEQDMKLKGLGNIISEFEKDMAYNLRNSIIKINFGKQMKIQTKLRIYNIKGNTQMQKLDFSLK
jgi:hypothetical protein